MQSIRLREWAIQNGIPWSFRTLFCLAYRGDFSALGWSAKWTVPPDGLLTSERQNLSAQIVRAGPEVLSKVHTVAAAGMVLLWNGSALVIWGFEI